MDELSIEIESLVLAGPGRAVPVEIAASVRWRTGQPIDAEVLESIGAAMLALTRHGASSGLTMAIEINRALR